MGKHISMSPATEKMLEELSEWHGTQSEAAAVAIAKYHSEFKGREKHRGRMNDIRRMLAEMLSIEEHRIRFRHLADQSLAEFPALVDVRLRKGTAQADALTALRDKGISVDPATVGLGDHLTLRTDQF